MVDALNYEIIRVFNEVFKVLGINGYLVGGAVRDMFLDKTPIDFDFTVLLNEEEHFKTSREIGRILGCSYKYNTHYHTAKFEYNGNDIDFVMARGETYPQIASKPVVYSSGIFDDIFRRDFSINSIAMKMGENYGEIVDPVDGIYDINRGIIRILHKKSFRDDPTRLFRGIKYASRFDFAVEDETYSLMKECINKGYLRYLKPQRIMQELYRILEDLHPGKSLILIRDLGVIDSIAGEKIHINLCYNENSFKLLTNKKKMAVIFYENGLEALKGLRESMGIGEDFIEEISKIKFVESKLLDSDEEVYKYLFIKQNFLDFKILKTIFFNDKRIDNFIKFQDRLKIHLDEINDSKIENRENFINWKVNKLIELIGG